MSRAPIAPSSELDLGMGGLARTEPVDQQSGKPPSSIQKDCPSLLPSRKSMALAIVGPFEGRARGRGRRPGVRKSPLLLQCGPGTG